MIRRRMDRASEMTVFLQIVKSGTLSAAARDLGLSPSAVSRIMTRLEDRLGVRLVVRTTRNLRLTAEGDAYARTAHRILSDLDEAEAFISDRGNPSGHIKVSAGIGHCRLVIVPLLGEFSERYPDIHVEMDVSDQVADVMGGRVDVAIRFGALRDSPLTARRIGETKRTVVASPKYLERAGTPKTPSDLAYHNCLNFSFQRLENGWPFREGGEDYLLPVTGSISANSSDMLVQLAVDGVGITRVGAYHLEEELAAGKLVPLLEDFNPNDMEEIHAVFVGGSTTPARVRVFVDYLVEKLRPQGLS